MAQQRRVRLELNEDALMRLLGSRQLCVADFHCLDRGSKERVKRICLANCHLAGR